MPRSISGVYSAPPGTKGVSQTTIASSSYNTFIDDLVADANAARPITAGGTGAITAVAALDELFAQSTAIASASTTNLANATGTYVEITGTTTITAFGTVSAGSVRILRFSGALTLTHNATSLILPGAANITTVAGDIATFVSEGSGNWRCVDYSPSSPVPNTANGQYKFPSTQNASSDANTLDDYEEGTFTPTVKGTSSAGVGTYSSQDGRYTKIGDVVYFRLVCSWTNSSGSGNLSWGGLPFNADAATFRASLSIVPSGIALSANNVICALKEAGNNDISAQQYQTGGSTLAAVPLDTLGTALITGEYWI